MTRHFWTKEEIIEALQAFNSRYDRPPGQLDFNPSKARDKGQHTRADNYALDGDYPHSDTVANHFGSWNKGLQAAGLPTHENQRRVRGIGGLVRKR